MNENAPALEKTLESVVGVVEALGNLNCPWSGYRPGELQFCEERLCSWIVAPAETWTNILYLLAGAMLWKKYRAHPQSAMRAFGPIAFLIGLTSTAYHASHIWVLETLDLGTMALLGALLVMMNLQRTEILMLRRPWAFFWRMSIFAIILTALVSGPARLQVFGAFIAVAVALEGFLAIRAKRLGQTIHYGYWWASMALFGFAYGFWWLDFRRVACDPGNHWISGHGAWHLIGACCFLTLARFYEQFGDRLKTAASPHSDV